MKKNYAFKAIIASLVYDSDTMTPSNMVVLWE
jgi:hypothetical protein